MNISQSTQKGKRDELNSFTYFTQVIGAQIFAKHQLQPPNLDFTMKPSINQSIFITQATTHRIFQASKAFLTEPLR